MIAYEEEKNTNFSNFNPNEFEEPCNSQVLNYQRRQIVVTGNPWTQRRRFVRDHESLVSRERSRYRT